MGNKLYNLSWLVRDKKPGKEVSISFKEHASEEKDTVQAVRVDPVKAIILYPSLLTPALGFKGGSLEILLLVEKGKILSIDHVRNYLKISEGLDKGIILDHSLNNAIELKHIITIPDSVNNTDIDGVDEKFDKVIELKNGELKNGELKNGELKNGELKFAGILDSRITKIYKSKGYEEIYKVVIKEIDKELEVIRNKRGKPSLNRGYRYTVKAGDTLEKIYLDHGLTGIKVNPNEGNNEVWKYFKNYNENYDFMANPIAKDQGDLDIRTVFADKKLKENKEKNKEKNEEIERENEKIRKENKEAEARRQKVIENNQSGATKWDEKYCRFVDKFDRNIIYAGEELFIPYGKDELIEEQDNILRGILKGLHGEPDEDELKSEVPDKPDANKNDFEKSNDDKYRFAHCFKVKDDDVYMTETDKANEILSYHPFIYYDDKGSKDNKVFSIGHLTDLHLVSRQQVLAKSNARVIEYKTGNEDNKNENEEDKKKNEEDKKMMDKISPEIGTLVNIYSKNVLKLLRELGTKADAICITGDFIDHINDVYLTDKQFKEVKKASDVWNIVETNNKRYYKRFVDFVMAYSIILDFYKKYQKPVFAVTGNHDFYDKAYGISPRVRIIGVRANKGICADHNLTIYEGILAFGETYAETGDSRIANSIVNTRGDNLKWFYSVFTPFSNFSVTMPKQILTGFGWGDDESLAAAKFLPVSNESMSQGQMKLLKQVREESKKNDNKKVILFSHFTFASYADSISNQKKDGEIKFEDSQLNNEYTLGTFRYRRIDVYKLLTEKNKEEEEAIVTCVITGHSHRRGLYTLGDTSWWSNDIKTTFNDFNNTDNTGNTGNIKNHPAIIVSDSAGPLPRYNYDGEFSGWGSSNPSGTLITFNGDGSAANCKVVSSDIENAKPRIAVAIDYFDIMKLGKKTAIQFQSNGLENKIRNMPHLGFTLKLHESLKELGLKIESTHIFRIKDKNNASKDKNNASKEKNNASRVELGKDNKLLFTEFWNIYKLDDSKKKIRHFVAIKFEKLSDDKFEHYNFDDYWAFEIRIEKKEETEPVAGRSIEFVEYSYEIMRDKKKAQKPDFKWRENFDKYKRKKN
ncbi:MAG: metallophosphoesterase [Leptospirales bacterium]|nr:metallophosphoesterase [Leptospirales bacterium]